MGKTFKEPEFITGNTELRFEDGEVCIYATNAGLKQLILFCEKLIESPKQGHIHLEDYEVLTTNSLKGTIAVFPEE